MTYNIPLTVSTLEKPVGVGVKTDGNKSMKAVPTIQIVDGEHYQGTYTVTPSTTRQTLATAGLVMEQNVTIEAIPQQYGLITWDGSVLTVS